MRNVENTHKKNTNAMKHFTNEEKNIIINKKRYRYNYVLKWYKILKEIKAWVIFSFPQKV